MGIYKVNVPHYNSSVVIDGNAYRISIRFTEGARAAEDVPVHSHSQYELLGFFNGSTYIQSSGHAYQVQGGECCLLQPHTYHLRRSSADATKSCTMFIEGPKNTPLDAMTEPCQQLQCAQEILDWFSKLEKELHSHSLGADSNAQALASLILVAVLRELDGQRKREGSDQNGSLVRYEDIIDDYIALHYAEDLRIGDLAEQLGITPRHLSRIMQQSYGCTFRQRLLDIRLYYAREYLTTTQLPVSQIAMRCGFTAESAFSAAFRKNVGCTPTQYRRSQQDLQQKEKYITEE